MFLKNSFLILSLILWIFPFSAENHETPKVQTTEIVISKLNLQKTVKYSNHEITLHDDLDILEFQDKIMLKTKNENIYYEVVQKFYTKDGEEKNFVKDDSTIILFGNQKRNTLQTVIVARNTGKMTKI